MQQEPKTHSELNYLALFLVGTAALLQDKNSGSLAPDAHGLAKSLPLEPPPLAPKIPQPNAQSPANGAFRFFQFLSDLWAELNKDRIFAVSAGVAFYGLLSFVPGLAVLISIYGLFTNRSTIIAQVAQISRVLPAEIASIIGDQALRIASQPAKTLGLALLISVVLSLWSSNAATKSTFDALNVAFETPEKRGTIGLNMQTIGFTLGGLLLGLVAIAASVVLPIALKQLWLGTVVETLLKTLTWPIFLVVVSLAIATLFRYGPSHTHPQWRWATPGVAFATLSWGGMSLMFSWYASNFGKFNETYGSLGAAAVLMTWLWLSALLVLTGAEIDSLIYDDPKPGP